ncbi:hypothetical protein NDU88_004534 [Pleurodeles waltl]|uniref:Uncharacterized protein n=1 Tax=Pleurodeles waltl TaxID=8319 RepID=A0AAV7PLA0_PLEWA|nr:hypothetical protein NDU88_004534 [Pleurodeles waltl]
MQDAFGCERPEPKRPFRYQLMLVLLALPDSWHEDEPVTGKGGQEGKLPLLHAGKFLKRYVPGSVKEEIALRSWVITLVGESATLYEGYLGSCMHSQAQLFEKGK